MTATLLVLLGVLGLVGGMYGLVQLALSNAEKRRQRGFDRSL